MESFEGEGEPLQLILKFLLQLGFYSRHTYPSLTQVHDMEWLFCYPRSEVPWGLLSRTRICLETGPC